MKFGDNLRKIRKSKKMSQEQLAEKMNVTRQSVSKWENGESYPEMNNIFELCKVFNCKLNELVYPDMSDISSLDEEIVMNAGGEVGTLINNNVDNSAYDKVDYKENIHWQDIIWIG